MAASVIVTIPSGLLAGMTGAKGNSAAAEALAQEALIRGMFIQAVNEGNEKQVDSFVSADADLVKIRLDDGATPLILAAEKGHKAVCAILLKAGADPLAKSKQVTQQVRGYWGSVTTHVILAEQTAMHRAIESGSLETVELLAQTKPLLDIPDGNKKSVFDLAEQKDVKILAVVVRAKCGADASVVAAQVRAVFWRTVQNGCGESLAILLEVHPKLVAMEDELSRTGLMWAARNGHDHICELLLKAGADANKTNRKGESALYLAAGMRRWNTVDVLKPHTNDADSIIAARKCCCCWKVFVCMLSRCIPCIFACAKVPPMGGRCDCDEIMTYGY